LRRVVLAAWTDAAVVKVVAILVIATVLTLLTRRLVNRRAQRLLARFTPSSIDPVREAARSHTVTSVTRSTIIGIIWTLAILAIFQIVNTALSTFVLAVTLLGTALTFGAQSLIRDVISGFFIILEDQYAEGDSVDLGVASGNVEKITLRVTRLRDAEGQVWWVPNGQIVRAGNTTQDWARAVVDVALARDSDIDDSSGVILDIARRAVARPQIAERTLEPPEVIGIEQITDSKLVLRVSVKVAKGAQGDVRRAIQAGVLRAFKDGRLHGPPMHPEEGGTA
jgi:small conductance mechanosensitive channel